MSPPIQEVSMPLLFPHIPPPRPIPPLPPLIAVIMDPAISLKPLLLVLFPFNIRLICLLSVKFPTIAAPCQRAGWPRPTVWMSCPPPPITLPNQPFIIPLFMLRSMMVSSSPSSMPVNIAWSDFFSTTFTFSTILAGMFLVAREGSSRKKVLPSMVIFLISSPLAVTLPSESTSTPGSFLSSCSSISLSVVLKDEALYSMVSFFTVIGFPTADTLAASSTWLSCSILTLPRARSLSATLISRE